MPATMPARTQPQTEFDSNMAEFVGALPAIGAGMDDAVVQVNAGAATATTKAGEATTKASEAAASAAEASATAGVSNWVSGTTYAQGVNVWSPANFRTYRRKVAGAGTTDPSSDATNWAPVGLMPAVARSARTANTILGAADLGNWIEITSGTFTQTAAAAATLGAGWYCYYENSGTGTITIDPNAAETIDGSASATVDPGYTYMIVSDGIALRTMRIDLPGAPMAMLGSATVGAAVANIDFLNIFTTAYDSYMITLQGVASSGTSVDMRMQLAKSGVVETTAVYSSMRLTDDDTFDGNQAAHFLVSPQYTGSTMSVTGKIDLIGVDTGKPVALINGIATGSGRARLDRAGRYLGTGTITGFRLFFGSGNVAAGTVRVYGIKNANI